MCTAMFDTEQHDSACQSHRLERDAPLVDRLTGVTHKAYFRDRAVLRGILVALGDKGALSH